MGDGGLQPLALGLHAQVGTDLPESHLDLPATLAGGEHGRRFPVGVGAEQGLGFALSGRVAEEQPAQGDGGLAGVEPEGGASGGQEAPLGAVGSALGQGVPGRGRVGGAGADHGGPHPGAAGSGR